MVTLIDNEMKKRILDACGDMEGVADKVELLATRPLSSKDQPLLEGAAQIIRLSLLTKAQPEISERAGSVRKINGVSVRETPDGVIRPSFGEKNSAIPEEAFQGPITQLHDEFCAQWHASYEKAGLQVASGGRHR